MLKRNIHYQCVMKRNLTCINYFIILEIKIFKRAHKNPNANVWPCQDVTFWAVGYHPPPPGPTSFSHILCKIREHTNVQKDNLGGGGGGGG